MCVAYSDKKQHPSIGILFQDQGGKNKIKELKTRAKNYIRNIFTK